MRPPPLEANAAATGVRRSGHGIATMNGKPYVVGGEDLGARATLHQVEEYDPARGSWREPASLPTALTAPGVVALPGAIPVVGGADATGAARREHFVFRVP